MVNSTQGRRAAATRREENAWRAKGAISVSVFLILMVAEHHWISDMDGENFPS